MTLFGEIVQKSVRETKGSVRELFRNLFGKLKGLIEEQFGKRRIWTVGNCQKTHGKKAAHEKKDKNDGFGQPHAG